MNYKRGSLWNKWDLHVHTPSSLVSHYGGNTDAIWERYITELEHLPSEFKVIGVNDYIFLDGYRKLLNAKSTGRLSNIELLLPVIELRLKEFGGTKNKLSRVNFHVLFSEELQPEVIEQQFINRLKTKYAISPKHEKLAKNSWSAVITKDSLEELGKLIISSVPEEEKGSYGSPLMEGFNNLNFTYEHIQECLNNAIFSGKFITAIGKTEWADIKWGESSVAEKKNIINSVDCVFISSYSYEDFHKSKGSLALSKVNDKLFDCSDAHYFSSSTEKDRIGKCYSWIKADTTFEGLRQALLEFQERVFTGDMPPKLKIVNSNKTKYINSLSIKKISGSKLKEHWFDTDLELNYGLVSIIGNKGGGKSALADVIGLLGNSLNEEWFSFLNEEKFRKRIDEKADQFEAKLALMSEDTIALGLGHQTNTNEIETIKYIPQNFFEAICNELGDIEESRFDKEIKKVIYSHVPKAERLGLPTLDEIIQVKTRETYTAIETLREQIRKINREFEQLEDKYTSENREYLQNQLKEKRKELESHIKNKPKEVTKPTEKDSKVSEEIEKLHSEKDKLVSDQRISDESLSEINVAISIYDRLVQMLGNLEENIKIFTSEFDEIGKDVDIRFNKLFSFTINKQPIEEALTNLNKDKLEHESKISGEGEKSITTRLREIDKKIKELEKKLDKPQQEYQKYLQNLKEWERIEKEIIGNKTVMGSIKNLEYDLQEIDMIPDKLAKLHKKRISHAKNIYKNLSKVCEIYRSLYKPVQDFIKNNPEIKDKSALSFDVSIINLGFQENFFDWIHRGATGSFYGANEGAKLISSMVAKYDFNHPSQSVEFVEDILDHLSVDYKSEKKEKNSIKSQLKKGKSANTLYDYLFSFEYLVPRYILKMGEKELSELSPGERGTLLLIFYLLVDKDDIPLVIDQPEHNLDNQTVYNVLVPAIKKAKTRRQIIIVTHNPNLAVVCNSDQIIYASLDIKDNHRLSYFSGAIENPKINKILVDILEGTWPAFDYRNNIYIPQS